MPHRPSRRELICDAALDLAATGGNHAVTHTAIDARLDIAKGSTSYYFRTRSALVDAAIAHLTDRSRTQFDELLTAAVVPVTVDSAVDLITEYLNVLLTARRRDLLARYAFAADAAVSPTMRAGLARCLFSPEAAVGLMSALGADDVTSRAHDLLSLLEGLAFDFTCGARSLETGQPSVDVRDAVRRWVAALIE